MRVFSMLINNLSNRILILWAFWSVKGFSDICYKSLSLILDRGKILDNK